MYILHVSKPLVLIVTLCDRQQSCLYSTNKLSAILESVSEAKKLMVAGKCLTPAQGLSHRSMGSQTHPWRPLKQLVADRSLSIPQCSLNPHKDSYLEEHRTYIRESLVMSPLPVCPSPCLYFPPSGPGQHHWPVAEAVAPFICLGHCLNFFSW